MTASAADSDSTPISERFALAALWVERYVLPWIFLYLAWSEFEHVRASYAPFHYRFIHGYPRESWLRLLPEITRNALLCCLLAFFGLTLFLSRRPAHLPKNLAHIIIPLAMSYYFFLYRWLAYLPYDLKVNLLPVDWQIPASGLAVFLAIIGYGISLTGLAYLRRSFALFVAVREVVSGGPYAYVRHPMYLGYIFEISGLVLAYGSLGMLAAAAGFLALMVTRARLEEGRLVEACPAYRDYMQRTGFLFPRFRRPIASAAEAKS